MKFIKFEFMGAEVWVNPDNVISVGKHHVAGVSVLVFVGGDTARVAGSLDEVVGKLNGAREVSKQLAFVWRNYRPEYTAGLAVVVASNRREADQALIELEKEKGHFAYPGSDWHDCEVFELGEPMAFLCEGGGL